MSEIHTTKCLIIGSGPAGYTAAIYAARAGLEPILYRGQQPGGQLTITNDVENFPGYADGVMGPKMMQDLDKQAGRFGTDLRYGVIEKVEFSKTGGIHVAYDDSGTRIEAESIVISTGAAAKWLGLPSEAEYNGKGVSACAICDGFFFKGQTVAVVGGGDTACEEASYLAKMCKKVYMIVRRDEFRASNIMQQRVMTKENIEILWNTETDEILGDGENVTSVRLLNNLKNEKHEIAIEGFFVAIGHIPNTGIFKGQLNMDESNYLITQSGSTLTNIPGVFASGDAQDKVYRQAVTAAGTGCMAALDAERYLVEKEAMVSVIVN